MGKVISKRGSEKLGERNNGGFLYASGLNQTTGASAVINPGSLSVHNMVERI
jgi:hypothetical protein